MPTNPALRLGGLRRHTHLNPHQKREHQSKKQPHLHNPKGTRRLDKGIRQVHQQNNTIPELRNPMARNNQTRPGQIRGQNNKPLPKKKIPHDSRKDPDASQRMGLPDGRQTILRTQRRNLHTRRLHRSSQRLRSTPRTLPIDKEPKGPG